MAFYAALQSMVKDLLKADTAGGLGQGNIDLVRSFPGVVNPLTPEAYVSPVVIRETVQHIGMVDTKYTSQGTLISTDFAYMTTVPATLIPCPGDTIEVGQVYSGKVVEARPFPPHGTPVYMTIYVNR